jgi:hypothetical protein
MHSEIDSHEALIFVISPKSVDNDICDSYFDYAKKLGKTIIPIKYKEVPADQVPAKISALEWIQVPNDLNNKEELDRVLQALFERMDR